MSAPTDPKVREAIIRDYRRDAAATHATLALKYHCSASTIADKLYVWLDADERYDLERIKKSYARRYGQKGTEHECERNI